MNEFITLLRPAVTEKGTQLEKARKYTFIVDPRATKIDIAKAFKKLYSVDVVKVNLMRTATKKRMSNNRLEVNKRPEYKKAIITVKGTKEVNLLKPNVKSK